MDRSKLRWLARCPMIPLHCQHITCHRPAWNGRTPVAVVDFSGCFEKGTVTAFQGSREGKTGLLMNILGMIERPDSGQIRVFGEAVLEMESDSARRLRDRTFGYLFTHPHLLPSFTVAENIAMPYLRHHGNAIDSARDRIAEVLAISGLPISCANLAVANLDEESLWRVAFARSIVHHPKILVAVSPPASFLIALAKSHALATGMVVLWNAGDTPVSGPCDRLLAPEKTK
ncbi:MAG: macrolide transport system ATP-binding/permease protein [Verrucomicrobiota bacterium]